jgi:type I restriction enzyme M protein
VRGSSSHYIHVADAEEYRPIAEILDELNLLEGEAQETNMALKVVLGRLGV